MNLFWLRQMRSRCGWKCLVNVYLAIFFGALCVICVVGFFITNIDKNIIVVAVTIFFIVSVLAGDSARSGWVMVKTKKETGGDNDAVANERLAD